MGSNPQFPERAVAQCKLKQEAAGTWLTSGKVHLQKRTRVLGGGFIEDCLGPAVFTMGRSQGAKSNKKRRGIGCKAQKLTSKTARGIGQGFIQHRLDEGLESRQVSQDGGTGIIVRQEASCGHPNLAGRIIGEVLHQCNACACSRIIFSAACCQL